MRRHVSSRVNTEAETLQKYLAQVRQHVVGVVARLTDEQRRQPVLPSGWSCVGLVNHLAIDVERFWFPAVFAGDQTAWDSFEEDDALAWDVRPDVSPGEVLALYETEIRRADDIIAGASLEAAPVRWPEDMFGSFRLDNLREIVMHVITETATHAGHLDAAVELMDRRQWSVLDDGRQPAHPTAQA